MSEDALPAKMFEKIRAGFEWSTHPLGFWRQHLYGHPSTSYHSYVYLLHHHPGNAVEEAAQLLRPALQKRWPAVGEAVAMEWWVHARHPCEGHQLHFDLDEARAATGQGLHHPLLSSVLFLSGTGGPTLVTSQSLGDGIRPATDSDSDHQLAWLVPPERNRLVVFDGSLLHGVLPGQPPETATGGGPLERRLTLMMAWHGPGASPQTSGPPIGPLRAVDGEAPWLTSLRCGGGQPCADVSLRWDVPDALSPLWEEHVLPHTAEGAGAGAVPEALLGEGLRYFALTAGDFERLYRGEGQGPGQ